MTSPSAFLFTTLLSVLCSTAYAASCTSSSWPGFSHLKHLFVFGDSYTSTSFNDTLTQPSPSNPLGNPPYPGYTSANGPNWVDFVTTTYNESLLLTYNLAYGGATVDSAYVLPYLPTVLSLRQQVQDEFIPTYGYPSNRTAAWSSNDTLFALWIGINDVGNSFWQSNETQIQSAIFTEYASLLDQLYSTGARNFLFLNVPPVQRSPLTVNATKNGSPDAAKQEQAAIEEWNGRVTSLAQSLQSKYGDVTTVTFDTYTLFNQVLDNPRMYPQTALYKNTTDFCPAYENGTPALDTLITSCGIPVNQYFWLNSLHPTYPMHNLTAYEVAKTLEGVIAGSGGTCSLNDSQHPPRSRIARRSWRRWAYE